MLFCHKIHNILMINKLLMQNLVVEIYALFPPIFLGWQIDPANFFAFWMYVSFVLQHLNCVDQFSMFHWHCTVRGSLEMVGREGGKSALAILVCPSPGVSPLWVEAEGGARLKHFHLTLLTQQHEQILMIQWWNQSNNWSIKVFFNF